ncbi:sensor histidine kinase [Ottowia thiooxydans]|uniref:histidine kinase n=1 Tax=Ottowia thiooxydans TaxID=219182 RepID=A0ABV2Q3F4_9BURK
MMIASLTMMFASLCLAFYAAHGFGRSGNVLDVLYAAAMLPWTLVVAVMLLTDRGWLGHDGPSVVRIFYQIAILSMAVFLLHGMGALHVPETALVGAQALLGIFLAALPMADLMWPPHVLEWGWAYMNGAFAAVLVARVIQLACRTAEPEGWIVLIVMLFALGVAAVDVQSHVLSDTLGSISHGFLAAALLVLWLVLSRRIETAAWKYARHADDSNRGQLAQDLHDGVGAHLTSIIAALATGTAQQRATALSLQHCLLELKVLVDGQTQDGSVLEHLASLRYRLQPLLQSAGLQMNWHISDEEVLERLRGDAALQVLRVAQEALANVVRHSGADEVSVACGYMKTTRCLVLEVVDNGIGLPSKVLSVADQSRPPGGNRGGKGLSGMARRANKLGGEIVIEPAQGRGTRVKLQLPLWRHLATSSHQVRKAGWASQLR